MKLTEREKELLAYASVCFDHCTDPFAVMHLQKKNVTLDECGDLSMNIAYLINTWIGGQYIDQAEKEFEETQQ